ncbi:MAG TPA: PHB depolymerase family esterase [Kofleriaceae bacterium]|nr:PHB depolymerase family esterase [Kofleriaceae bacterium]
MFPIKELAVSCALLAITACGSKHDDATSDARPFSDARAPADASSSTVDGATCAVRTGMRGLTKRTVMVGTTARTYLVYLPASADAATPMPFVFVFHGYSMSGQEMYDLTQYAALADSEGIALAFPDGEGGPDSLESPWDVENPGQVVCGDGQDVSATGDDFAFMDAIRADVTADQCIDGAHVFATGFSMGGYFTEHVGCYRSDIRGLAPHSGGTLADLAACTTAHVPIILFHGLADSVIDDACDDPSVTPDQGFTAAATLWAAKNGCAATYQTVAADGSGGGSGRCRIYDDCPADGQVELCTFDAMDHCWAGGATAGAAGNSCPTYASATQLEWSFFKQYAW